VARRRVSVSLAAVATALAAAEPRPPTAPTVAERLRVREVEVLLAPPAVDARRTSLRPEDFVVREGGVVREVAKVEAPGGPQGIDERSWSVVIWVDEVLASPPTVHAASLSLALQAEALAELGEVTVLAAAPAPRSLLATSRAPERIREVLAEVAGRAAGRGDPRASAPAVPGPPEPVVLRRQLDRLLVALTTPLPPSPRLLVLAADGYALSPAEANLLAGTPREGGPAERARARAIEETGRALAAYGWVSVALPARPEEALAALPRGEDYQEWRERNLDVDHGEFYPVMGRVGRRPPTPPAILLPRLEAALSLHLEPLRALTRPGAGAVVEKQAHLASTLAEIAGRWRLWYRAPEAVEGDLRPLAVEVVRSGVEARAPAWTRSGTPRALAEARLRRLFAPGPRLDGGLQLSLAGAHDPEAGWLRVVVEAAAGQAAAVEGPLRLSVGFEGEEPTVAVHAVLEPPASEDAWESRSSFPWPAGAPRATLLLEDLARGAWLGAVVRRAPGG
jgi:hypothetical protein